MSLADTVDHQHGTSMSVPEAPKSPHLVQSLPQSPSLSIAHAADEFPVYCSPNEGVHILFQSKLECTTGTMRASSGLSYGTGVVEPNYKCIHPEEADAKRSEQFAALSAECVASATKRKNELPRHVAAALAQPKKRKGALDIPEQGLRCTVTNCTFVCTVVANMERHFAEKHTDLRQIEFACIREYFMDVLSGK